MLKPKIFNGGAGLPIFADSRGGSQGGAGYPHPDDNGAGNSLSRDSMLDAEDARDSIFISKMAKKQSRLPKKVRFTCH